MRAVPRLADLGDVALHWREDGEPAGRPVVFANSLGTDLRIWDAVVALLPAGLRVIRYDMRGHGLSACPPGPYSMGALVRDAERLMDHAGARGAAFVGLSVGGMVGQALAVKRPDLVAALVLSNTAAKIGTPQTWEERVEAIRAGGMAALSEAILTRWFSTAFRAGPEIALWRAMVERTPAEGYAATCAAISGTDLLTSTSGLRLPALAIAGSEDGSTPPDLVRETAALIPGARFELIRGAGHIPCVEVPEAFSGHLAEFLARTSS